MMNRHAKIARSNHFPSAPSAAISSTHMRSQDDGASRRAIRLTRLPRRVDIVLMAASQRVLPGAFTVETYHRLGELGVFHEDDRVELINGQIVPMTPIGDAHAACVQRLNTYLGHRTELPVVVSMQNPVVLDPRWEPQPDIAVLRRDAGLAGRWHATARDVVLIIEVAESSLVYDRDVKIPQYAEAGIPEAWLVDVNAETITVYRHPTAGGYRETAVVERGHVLRPDQLPAVEITADEILG
jgi:Uma2 family endonuclease